jgi:hypothetical protein
MANAKRHNQTRMLKSDAKLAIDQLEELALTYEDVAAATSLARLYRLIRRLRAWQRS